MINFTLTIFMILTLSSAGALETIECHEDANLESITDSIIVLNNSHHNEAESDCEDNFGHCSHHCSGIHNILDFKIVFVLKNIPAHSRYVAWDYQNHYL